MRTIGLAGALFVVLAACGGDGATAANGVASVALNAPSLSLLVGRSDQLVATATNAQGNTIVNAPVAAWRSSNPAVATVNASGLVSAMAVGTADVTATIASRAASVRVTVTSAPSTATVNMAGITFAPFHTTIRQGGTVTYVFPSVAHNVIFERVTGAPTDIPGQVSNQSIARTFPTARLYQYACTLHPGMSGEVDVVP